MPGWKVAASKQLKRRPPLFDRARRITRLWSRTPIYDLLEKASRQLPEVAFIQIGSNDGISIDPIREFVVANASWHGVFVEPVPRVFEQLRRNYSYLRGRKLAFFNLAVSRNEGAKQLWKIRDECLSEFPLFAYQIASFDREHIFKLFSAFSDLEAKIEAIEVPCKTYEQVREQAGLSSVHVLHLDVEGHEDQILNSIDFSRSKPLIILFETCHMSESAKGQIHTMLQSHTYCLQEAGADCIATLRDFEVGLR
jgi:FkbM family methyltransferase